MRGIGLYEDGNLFLYRDISDSILNAIETEQMNLNRIPATKRAPATLCLSIEGIRLKNLRSLGQTLPAASLGITGSSRIMLWPQQGLRRA